MKKILSMILAIALSAGVLAGCGTQTENVEKEPVVEETVKMIAKKQQECPYGLCLIASNRKTLSLYEGLEKFGCDLFEPSSRNLANTLIVSPTAEADLYGYRDFIFLDAPTDLHIKAIAGRQVFVNGEISGDGIFQTLDVSRERLLEIFSVLRREFDLLSGNTVEELAASCNGLGFPKKQFIFALSVFEELGLVAIEEGKLIVYRGVKAELFDSALYCKICQVKGC